MDDSLKNVSFSMYIDHKKLPEHQRSFNNIQQRQLNKWVEDKSATNCFNCNAELLKYYLFNRKHHCRVCGHIFCDTCTSNRVVIPEYYPESLPIPFIGRSAATPDIDKVRVCDTCYIKVDQFKKIHRLVQVFDIVGFDILDFQKYIKPVCTIWRQLANIYLSAMREIQYKLPGVDNINKFEKRILWVNRKHLTCHSKYLLQLLKSVKTKQEIAEALDIARSGIKLTECNNLMCTRWCNTRITPEDALDLLCPQVTSVEIRQFVVELLDQAPLEEFLCYVPYLVHALSYAGLSVISNYLIGKCVKENNQTLNTKVYLQLRVGLRSTHHASVYQQVLTHFRQRVSNLDLKHYNQMTEHINQMRTHAQYSSGKSTNPNKCITGVLIPTNPDAYSATVVLRDIVIKESHTRPLYIPYHYIDKNKQIKTGAVLYKENDDVRKDQVIITAITLIDRILKKELNTDFHIITYPAQPIGIDSGFIEIVPNSETVSHIQENFTILNYIIEHNKTIPVYQLKDRFIKSCAAYCVITYLLGIGDRHLDNIMITREGVLFHIDYGYILGFDPKLADTDMRISTEIVEALGGQNSSDYAEFQKMSNQIYTCLRRHVNLFTNILRILVEADPPVENSVRLTEEILMNEILRRFVPGEIHQEAEMKLYKIMDNSSAVSWWWIDKLHQHNKETPKAIKRFLYDVVGSVRGMVSSAVEMVYYS